MANVLIVDDDFDCMELSTEILELAGHHIQTGKNGEEGLKSLLTGELPDCVLLDVDMPILSGPGMAHQMFLNDGGEEKIPILLVSGRTDLDEIARRMGTPYFLPKATPNFGAALLRMLARALDERRPPASA
jgi:DNA-binding NtrC family response regulator